MEVKMNTKPLSLMLVLLFAVAVSGVRLTAEAQGDGYRDAEPRSATLLSQITHRDFAKANFNFQLGVRGDSVSPPTRNIYDLRYGGVSYDGDNDWLDVPISHGSRSKIIDMGPLNWSDAFDIPVLPANPEPYNGARTILSGEEKFARSLPENTLVNAIVGHMYLLHAKSKERDLYVLFRVESLKSGDEVTITWKVIPSPENY